MSKAHASRWKRFLRRFKHDKEEAPSTFQKRRKNYDHTYHYIEDVEYPSKWQRFQMIVGNAYWHKMILGILFIEVMLCLHMPIAGQEVSTAITELDCYKIVYLLQLFYVSDIILTCYVQYGSKLQFYNEAARPWWVLLCETFACLPFELFSSDYELSSKLQVFKSLKLVRLFYYFYKLRLALGYGLSARILKFFCSVVISESIFAWLYFTFSRAEGNMAYYIQVFEISSAQIVGKGGIVSKRHYYSDSVWYHEVPLTCGSLFVLFVILKPTLCDIISWLTMQNENKYKYFYKVTFFESVVVRMYQAHSTATKLLTLFLRNYWEERHGYMRTDNLEHSMKLFFSRSLFVELCLDCSFDVFRHSLILRNLETPVVRFLAPSVKYRLYMRGEYIYHKRTLVDYMVYVHRGNIDVLSRENGDAGILSLTAGTVIGEASLLCPYRSSVNVRCQSMCEVFTLHRNDFLQLTRGFPSAYTSVLRMIKSRYLFARRIYSAKLMEGNQEIFLEQLIWLKSSLHRLKAVDNFTKKYHLMTNIYLSPFLDRLLVKQNSLLHTVRYLELLSIKPRYDVNLDLVFVRSQCMWILKYDSPIYKVWDIFIGVIAFVVLLLQPYVIFYENTAVIHAIVIIAYGFFLVDLLLSMITPTSANSTATTLREVFVERFRSYGLYLDLLSLLHIPMFRHALPFSNARWVFIIHAVKIWKVYRIMNKWQQRCKLNLLLQKYCVFVFSFFIYVYTLGFILVIDEVVDVPTSPVAVQIATGVSFKIKNEPLKATILYAFINTFAVVFESIGVVSVTSANYMKYMMKSKIFHVFDQLNRLTKRSPDSHLFRRLGSFLNTQINDNEGFLCAFNVVDIYRFTDYYMELLMTQLHFLALKDRQLFALVPQEIIKRLSAFATVFTFHRHAIILRYGMMYDHVHILIRGEASTLYGDRHYKTRLLQELNFMEILFGMPCVFNVVGLTEVTVVSFPITKFMELLETHYPAQHRALLAAVELARPQANAVLGNIFRGKQIVIKCNQHLVDSSFIRFRTKDIYEDSYEEFDYYVPFDKIYPFSFVRLFLLKRTIYPQGKFLFWWEVSRCFLGYLAALVFFIPPLSLQTFDYSFTYVLLALDFTALADIYVRLHVCYYNDKGILISHPLCTAKYYIANGFVMDLLGMLPLYLIVLESPHYRIVFNLFHLLQLHRLIGFKQHFFYTTYFFDYIFIVMTIICPMNLITCFIYMIDCYDWRDDTNVEVSCRTFQKDSQIGNYVTVSYFIMSALTCSGTGTIVDLSNAETYIYMMMSLCSFASMFIRIYVTAYLFGCYNKIFTKAYRLRDGVRRLMNYLCKEKVEPYLRKQIKIYYELYWYWLYNVNPIYLARNLNPALRRDLTYCLFGEKMHLYSKLEDISNVLGNFYKNILYNCEPLIIPKNGYILTINDIHSKIYVVHRGSVDVVAADGTVIDTIYNGAFFGNMDGSKFYRQRVSFVSNTVAKVIHLNSAEFHKMLGYFPRVRDSFTRIRAQKLYYVPSTYEESAYEKEQWHWSPEQLQSGFRKYYLYYIFSWVHFIFPCCIGLQMELYQMGVGEMHYVFLSVQYLFDIIHLVHQYLRFYVPYVSRQEEFVMNPIRIKAHTMGKKRLWYKLYFLNLPIDYPVVIILLMMGANFEDWTLLIALLRLNRLMRWINVAIVYKHGCKKIASFSKLFKIFLLFLFLIFSIEMVATLLAMADYSHARFSSTNHSQIIMQMPINHLRNLPHRSVIDKFHVYIRYYYLSVLLHTFTHDDLYFPQSTLFELLFILLFLYVTIFESFIMVHYYQIMMESTALLKIVYNVRKYVEAYYGLNRAAYVLQSNVDESIKHYYAIKCHYDDYLLDGNCPTYLMEAAKVSVFGYLFRNHPYFDKAHPDMLRQLVRHMRCTAYPINCIVVNRRDCRETMFFVHSGEVAAVLYDSDYTGNAEHLFRKGDSFGFEQAFRGKPFVYTYRTVTFCEIVELEWTHIKHIIRFFPMSQTFINQNLQDGVTQFIQKIDKETRLRKRRI